MSTDIVLYEADDLITKYPVLDPASDLAAVIRDNVGDADEFNVYDLDKVTVPSGGGSSWDLPDGDPTRHLVGVPVGVIKRRSFWEQSIDESDGTKGPPDCSSDDNVHGRGLYGVGSELHPSGECATCPMNKFEEKPGGKTGGKPCKEQSNILLMTEGAALPLVLQLAPTSIKFWRKFMLKLTSKGVPYYEAVVKIGLKKVEGKVDYSVIVPELEGRLTPEAGQVMKGVGDNIVGAYANRG